ncbi:MAG: hypothetical protein Q7U31_03850 [Anaerolineaceae bacterium]|jgi:hypothetical protein|nr:hypothetical protein [Anaerolineaceae bacterium]
MSGQTDPLQRLRLPPYGKQLVAMRKAGQVPAQNVVLALDWSLGAIFPRVVIPDALQIQQIDLSFIAGLEVLIAYRRAQAHRVNELAQHALQFHPKALYSCSTEGIWSFIKLGSEVAA